MDAASARDLNAPETVANATAAPSVVSVMAVGADPEFTRAPVLGLTRRAR